MSEPGTRGASIPPQYSDHYRDEQGRELFVMNTRTVRAEITACEVGFEDWTEPKIYSVEEFERVAAGWEFLGNYPHQPPPEVEEVDTLHTPTP